MSLLAVRDLSLAFGGPALLDRAQCAVEPRERICVLGRNGEGKSTLLKVLNGEIPPDAGEFERQPGLRIASLPQEVPQTISGTVFDIAVQGSGKSSALLTAYHEQSMMLADPEADMDAVLAKMADLQHELEACGGWEIERLVEVVLDKLGLDADAAFDTLSGGMKRRVLLGRALVCDPDILLLDEPTNHLDFESIAWLEEFLLGLNKAVIFITHDRAFLRRVASRIWELDRGKLRSFDCDYETYLLRKEALLDAETVQNAAFDKKLAKEEVWIRQGIKARRTRNEGRVRKLKALRVERSERREQREGPSFGMADAGASGAKVITTHNLSYHWGEQAIVRDFTSTIWRGDKVGIIGPNGSGKTTLLQLLLGKLAPQVGTVKHGTQLQIAYFDQHRMALDPNATVRHAVADGHEHIVQGDRKRHVLSYLQEFLFDPQMAIQPVRSLSGGERNRLLLARLFAQPANLLVLDEPTNDLDLESLELLEDLLVNYTGTLLLVSHDREFLDNVVGYTYALEGPGKIRETVGGYSDYQRVAIRSQPPKPAAEAPKAKSGKKSWKQEKPRTRNNREKRELEALPAQIEELEARHTELGDSLGNPAQYTGENTHETTLAEMKQIEAELEKLYARWQELEAIPE